MNDQIKIQVCKDDFYVMMREAVLQAGGADNIDKWKDMKLDEIVSLLSQNGIRMVYMPEKHMDNLKITWENPKPKKQVVTVPYSHKPDIPFPKKKQLLCDQKDNIIEEDEFGRYKWTRDEMGG